MTIATADFLTYKTHTANVIKIGDGTAQAMQSWIERFSTLVSPNNHVEYWSPGNYTSLGHPNNLPVPDVSEIEHEAVYWYRKGEGIRLEVNLQKKDGSLFRVCAAKMFGKADDASILAGRIAVALNELLSNNSLPSIVEFERLLPGVPSGHNPVLKKSSVVGPVEIVASDSCFKIGDSEKVIFEEDEASLPTFGSWRSEHLRNDWVNLLNIYRIPYVMVDETKFSETARSSAAAPEQKPASRPRMR